MDKKNPNVDLQDPAFNARVISVLRQERKERRKQLIVKAIVMIGGAIVGYASHALVTLPPQ